MFSSLRYRNFRLFFTGQVISLVGSWMQQAAQSWLVYRLGGDSLHLGLLGFCGQLPSFLLGLYAGVLVDRMNRLRFVLCTQSAAMLQAAALAALALYGQPRLWQLYALAAALGLVNAFDLPARQVLIGELVPAEHRANAIALNSTIVNGSRMLGPALAGALIPLWGEGACFALNAASFLAVLWALGSMRGVPVPAPAPPASALGEIRGGLAYVSQDKPILLLFILLAALSAAGMPFAVLLPVFAGSVLGGSSRTLGLLMGGSGLGAMLGALFLARRAGRGLERLVRAAPLLFGAALVCFACSRSLWLSALLMGLIGLGAMVQLGGINALLQELSEERFRGRVMGLYAMIFLGLSPFGSLAMGAAASSLGAPAAVALGGGICLLCGLCAGPPMTALVAQRRRAPSEGRLEGRVFLS